MSAEPLHLLGEAAWWSAMAIVLVLVLRRPFIRGFGIRVAVLLWLLVPLATIAAVLPARTAIDPAAPGPATVLQLYGAPTMRPVAAEAAAPDYELAAVVMGLWLAGFAASVLLLAWRQLRFRRSLGPLDPIRARVRQSGSALAGPLVLGLARPVVVVPPNFRQRFDRRARRLMLAHEFAHLRRCDPLWNAVAAAMRCVFWFNPLVHWGARRFRRDQELACDAYVLAQRRRERKAYARTLLAVEPSPGSASALAFGPHPLEERIRMIAENADPSGARATLGRGAAALLCLALAAAAWASNPRADVATASAAGSDVERFAVDVEVMVDGRSEAGSLTVQGDVAIAPFEGNPRVLAERTLSFEHAAPESGWSADVTVERIADDRFRIAAEISRNGELVSTPTMITAAESPAFVETADPETGRPAYRLSFTPRPVSALEASAVGGRAGESAMLFVTIDGSSVARWVEWPGPGREPVSLNFHYSGEPEPWQARFVVERFEGDQVGLCLEELAHPALQEDSRKPCMRIDATQNESAYMFGSLGESGPRFRIDVIPDKHGGDSASG